MTEAAKKPAKPKAAASGVAHSAKTEAQAKKTSAGAGEVKLTQTTGSIARKWDQLATLRGLGLGKRHKSSVLKDSPEVRGMIYKVRHLVKVES